MNIFISWSGERSKSVARALKEWLPLVIQGSIPWMSVVDIDKGSPWFEAIEGALNDATVGIFVVTPENARNPWLNYEAGAMAQMMSAKRACPLLIGMGTADVQPPLSQLNLTDGSNRDDVLQLIQTIRPATFTADSVRHAFERDWEALDQVIQSQVEEGPPEAAEVGHRSDTDKLDEILEMMRGQARRNSMPKDALLQPPDTSKRLREQMMKLGRLYPETNVVWSFPGRGDFVLLTMPEELGEHFRKTIEGLVASHGLTAEFEVDPHHPGFED